MNGVFDVDTDKFVAKQMQKQQMADMKQTNLISTQHSQTLRKFCDLCTRINIDPLHAQALPTAILMTCKSKHTKQIIQLYYTAINAGIDIENFQIDSSNEKTIYSSVLSSMTDWLVLFQYLIPRQILRNDVLNALESNEMVQRMQKSLTSAQVVGTKFSSFQTALYAFLFLAPCSTPAGKMLEHLYCQISNNPVDAEIRCLRAMTLYKDTTDDEELYVKTLNLVMQSFEVKEEFKRCIEVMLRKNEDTKKIKEPTVTRPLLKVYARNAQTTLHLSRATNTWLIWKNSMNFPIVISTYMQKFLYFICCQQEPVPESSYTHLYQQDTLSKALATSIDIIDVECLQSVIHTLRIYNGRVKTLIDFRQMCLGGLSTKMANELTLAQIMQLYVVAYQHPSIVEILWKSIVPVYNHTIIKSIESFIARKKFEVEVVLENLLECMLT